MRKFGVAQDERGEVDGQESGAVRHGACRVRGHGDGKYGDRVEAGGGQRQVFQAVRPDPAHRDPDGGADQQFQGDLADQLIPVIDWSAAENATTRITTGASLKPDSASRTPVTRLGSETFLSTENTAAASVEDTTAPMISDCRHSRPTR